MEGKVVEIPRMGPRKFISFFLALVIVFAVVFPLRPWAVVGPGQRGVVVQLGAVQPQVLGEGIHFRLPVIQRVELVNVQVQKVETQANAASKDLQTVTSTVALNFHVDPGKANLVFQHLGTEFQKKIIDPSIHESVKAATALYTAEELITKRQTVSQVIQELLAERLLTYNIIVDDFSVVNFEFSQEFNKAIEAKQTAEQLALKAQRDLERIKIEAEQKITQAKAEAEALRLQKQEVTPELVRLREIEAQITAINKWDGKLPQVTGGAVPFINIDGSAKQP